MQRPVCMFSGLPADKVALGQKIARKESRTTGRPKEARKNGVCLQRARWRPTRGTRREKIQRRVCLSAGPCTRDHSISMRSAQPTLVAADPAPLFVRLGRLPHPLPNRPFPSSSLLVLSLLLLSATNPAPHPANKPRHPRQPDTSEQHASRIERERKKKKG